MENNNNNLGYFLYIYHFKTKTRRHALIIRRQYRTIIIKATVNFITALGLCV